jgi:GT2 family glycosyltransferase
MIWALGILTWNEPATCARTLEALRAGISGPARIVVLDNGSDVPFTDSSVEIVREPKNLGAGGGLSALVRHVLTLPIEALLFVEDDWRLERPLALSTLDALLGEPDVGQVRLAMRPASPRLSYYTYGLTGTDARDAAAFATAPLFAYAGGHYQRIRSLWSNNPFACRRDVAERFLLTGWDEKRMARPYYAAGLTTIATTPGHFRHPGAIRDRRGKPGWRK